MHYLLIVDDHADSRRLLSITLGRQSEVLEAANGAAALQAIRKHQPMAVLLDVMMPGELDGLQLLDAIRAATRGPDSAALGPLRGMAQGAGHRDFGRSLAVADA